MVERLSTRAADRRHLDRVYGAIADPTRRAMLEILAGGEVNVGMLAQRFSISFNGVSKHVKVLEQAGLVRRNVRGREHWLTLRPAPLREASRWLEHYRQFWDTRLEALEDFLLQEQRSRGRALGPSRGRISK
jgi:DNA-binding transcriptional ArsR family regulator